MRLDLRDRVQAVVLACEIATKIKRATAEMLGELTSEYLGGCVPRALLGICSHVSVGTVAGGSMPIDCGLRLRPSI